MTTKRPAVTPMSPAILRRKVGRYLKKNPLEFLATCTPGFEKILATELSALPQVNQREVHHGAVIFSGGLDTVYEANLRLRTANLILMRIGKFLSQTTAMLYNHARKLPWELPLSNQCNFNLRITTKRSKLNFNRPIQETLTAAIKNRLSRYGRTIEYDRQAKLTFYIRLFEDRCTVSLNTTGDRLYLRGYRSGRGPAPIRATTAAAAIAQAMTHSPDLVYDPFCGSGTLVFEAGLAVENQPPGLSRTFAFQHTPYYSRSTWYHILAQARSGAERSTLQLLGSDVNPRIIPRCLKGLQLTSLPLFWTADALDTDLRALRQTAKTPLLITNLPYGTRIGSPGSVKRLVKRFCSHLISSGAGWSYGIITKHPEVFQDKGLPIHCSTRFSNGGIPVSLISGTIPV